MANNNNFYIKGTLKNVFVTRGATWTLSNCLVEVPTWSKKPDGSSTCIIPIKYWGNIPLSQGMGVEVTGTIKNIKDKKTGEFRLELSSNDGELKTFDTGKFVDKKEITTEILNSAGDVLGDEFGGDIPF